MLTSPPMSRSNRVLYGLYQVYKVFVMVPWLTATTFVFGCLAVVLAMLGKVRLASGLCGGGWARANAALTPMRVSVDGRDNVEPGQSYVIVSNHLPGTLKGAGSTRSVPMLRGAIS